MTSSHRRQAPRPWQRLRKIETIKPCLKEIVLNSEIKELGDAGVRDEHRGRVAVATELLIAGYSDEACHEFFSRMEDYDPRTDDQPTESDS